MFVCYNFLEILMMKRVKMRILGIDPGYAILGYGIIDVKGNKFSPVDYGAVLTEASMDMPRRLKTLYGSLAQLIRKYEPDEASIEELFFNNNAKTAILVGEARGVAAASAVLLHRFLRLDHLIRIGVIPEQPHSVAVVVSLLGEKQRGHRVVGFQLDQGIAVVAGGGYGIG